MGACFFQLQVQRGRASTIAAKCPSALTALGFLDFPDVLHEYSGHPLRHRPGIDFSRTGRFAVETHAQSGLGQPGMSH